MIFKYKATDQNGEAQTGTIDASSKDSAINALQRRGLLILSIEEEVKQGFFSKRVKFLDRVSTKEVVFLSRQIATLFEASVSVLDAFKLLASESENEFLREKLAEVTDDIQSGTSISDAMAKHPSVFSPFYVSMVKSGEESGKLPETLNYLADYLERSYELTRKARNALVYPIFVIIVFILVMILMLVVVIPQLTEVLLSAGQEIPIYTRIVIGTSSFLVQYGIFILVLLIIGGFFLWRYTKTKTGRLAFDRFKLNIPFVGVLYKKLFLSRISDNFNTMLSSGISMVRTIEISAEVVDSEVYKNILLETSNAVKRGDSISEAFSRYEDIPEIMVQMMKIGEETGKTGFVLKTVARFYKREVDSAVENVVNLIEPVMIIILAVGVAIMLASILVPIYNVASSI